MTRQTSITISEQLRVRTSLVVVLAVVSAVSGAVWSTKGAYDELKNSDTAVIRQQDAHTAMLADHEDRLKKLESTRADIAAIRETDLRILQILEQRRGQVSAPHMP